MGELSEERVREIMHDAAHYAVGWLLDRQEVRALCNDLLAARAEIERLHDRIAELQRNAARGATEI